MERHSNNITESTPTIVVGFRNAARSSGALRWSIERSRVNGAAIRVVHASAFPLTAHDGPSASVAQQLGNPSWATLHSTVAAFTPPSDVHTVADQGSPIDVLRRWSKDASVVVLGRASSRRFGRSLASRLRSSLDVPVLEIDESDLGVLDLAAERPRRTSSTHEGRISS